MKLCAITVASDRSHPGLKRLRKSLDHHGWNLFFAGEPGPWLGFTTKLLGVRDLLPKLKADNYTHVMFTDAYDTIVIGGPAEVLNTYTKCYPEKSLILSCEIACWPDADKEKSYPKLSRSKWKHVNSGGYVGEIDLLIKILEGCEKCEDDQRWFTDKYLNGIPIDAIFRDDGCKIFQTLGHVYPWPHQKWSDSFGFDGCRPVNWETETRPVVWHQQGGGSTNNYAPWLFKEE